MFGLLHAHLPCERIQRHADMLSIEILDDYHMGLGVRGSEFYTVYSSSGKSIATSSVLAMYGKLPT